MISKNIFGAFTVAVALFFLWPAVFGSWQEKNALQAALAEHEAILAERTRILEKAQTEYATYQKISQGSSGQIFASLVPQKKDAAELVSAAQAIAATSGLQLVKIQMAESKTPSQTQYATLLLTVELSGPYTGLRSFLGDLEKYVRILNVKSVLIASDEQTGELRFSIKAETYYIK